MSQMFQYELWSDNAMRTLAIYYGAASSMTAIAANRVTRVLDSDGNVVLEYNSIGGVATHPSDVLEDCTILFGP